MARTTAELIAILSLRDEQFHAARKAAVREAKRSGKEIQSSFDSISFKKMVAGYAAVTAAVYATWRTVSAFSQAASESEKSTSAMNATLKMTGIYSASNSKMIQALASEMQRLTVEEDDATVANISLMQGIGRLSAEEIPRATKAAIGLSRVMKVDTATAFFMVGKAAAGHTELFGKYGITLDKNMSAQEKFNAILDRGISAFALATAEIETHEGKLMQAANSWDDFSEAVGGFINLGLDAVLPTATSWLTKFTAETVRAGKAWADLYSYLSMFKRGQLRSYDPATGNEGVLRMLAGGDYYSKEGPASENWTKPVPPPITPVPPFSAFGKSRAELVAGDFRKMQMSGAYRQMRMGRAEQGVPMTLAVDDPFEKYMKKLRGKHLAAGLPMMKVEMKSTTDLIKEETKNWVGAFRDFGMQATDILGDTFFDILHGKIKSLKDIWASFADAVQRSFSRGLAQRLIMGNAEGKGGLLSSLFSAADGGVFSRPSVTTIAERGPEAVIPLRGGKVPVQMSGGGGSPSIIITGNTFTDVNQLTALMKNVALAAVRDDYLGNGMIRKMVRS